MTASPFRAIVSLVLTPCLALSAIVAPEHIHEADADHPRQAVHRHFQPHTPDSPDAAHLELADDDHHIVWLADASTGQRGYEVTPVAYVANGLPVPVLGLHDVRLLDEVVAPAHGPPKTPAAPRAPPVLPV